MPRSLKILFLVAFIFTGFATAQPPKADKADALKLTDTERKQLEPLQAAVIETNQELAAAADALDQAKPADVLAAAWRWKAAVTAFKAALANRGNWISATAKAKGCDGCELNLQAMEFQRVAK